MQVKSGRQGKARQGEGPSIGRDLVGQSMGRSEVRGNREILPGDSDRSDPERDVELQNVILHEPVEVLAWMPTEGKLANKLACRSMKSPGISAVFDWACYPTPRMIDTSDPTSSETSEACRSAYPCRFPPVIPGVFSFLRIVPAKACHP